MALNYKSIASNAAVAFLSQGISFALSFLTSLIVPKILGVEEFGYWQLFMFYIAYVGFCHLGLNDGVYLVNGGKARASIPKRSIKSQFLFSLGYQCVFSLILIIVAIYSRTDSNRAFVIGATAFFLLINNATSYLTYTLQAMNETKKASYAVMIERLVFLLPLLLYLFIKEKSFEPYVLAYACSKTISLLFCIYCTKDILKAKFLPLSITAREAWNSIGIGWKLMIANIAGTLIIGIARFFIDTRWGIKDFGEVSFALSLVTFFMSFVSQASMVLFPALRQSNKAEQARFYTHLRSAMSIAFPALYVLYVPIAILISLWLPQYNRSLAYFAILLPMCVFDSRMNLAGNTFFKVLRKEQALLIINCVTVAFSTVGVLVGVYIAHSIRFILLSTVIVVIIRSIISEKLIGDLLDTHSESLIYQELAITIVFLTMTYIFKDSWLVAVTMLTIYVLYAIFNRKYFASLIRQIRKIDLSNHT